MRSLISLVFLFFILLALFIVAKLPLKSFMRLDAYIQLVLWLITLLLGTITLINKELIILSLLALLFLGFYQFFISGLLGFLLYSRAKQPTRYHLRYLSLAATLFLVTIYTFLNVQGWDMMFAISAVLMACSMLLGTFLLWHSWQTISREAE